MSKIYDNVQNPVSFFCFALGSISLGLVIGGLIDGIFRKIQNDGDWTERKRIRAALYFFLQSFINITVLFVATKVYPNFINWFQLSISGALFGVVLFTAQRNLVDNALCLTHI